MAVTFIENQLVCQQGGSAEIQHCGVHIFNPKVLSSKPVEEAYEY